MPELYKNLYNVTKFRVLEKKKISGNFENTRRINSAAQRC